ncbi:hypothetical protein [Marinigracilibium pacificum]|uniref:Uncharacterized protein n=1 Tax=Marinigracilibium pacificum TaxID=2729599 RepID=A0A848J2D5_9BACT|nr:hypothetical protein [Marinigracilibium pacificum]NMM50757.1 hypothetical protein [Marinigracilibium pacificum]
MKILNRCLVSLSVVLVLISCDIPPHNIDEIEFHFLNKTSSDIQYKTSYDGIESRYLTIELNDEEYTGGGGILDIDSLVFIKVNTLDTIKYINGEVGLTNDVFNRSNWKRREHNNFYYMITDEDFI